MSGQYCPLNHVEEGIVRGNPNVGKGFPLKKASTSLANFVFGKRPVIDDWLLL